jgi:hypothetical protein
MIQKRFSLKISIAKEVILVRISISEATASQPSRRNLEVQNILADWAKGAYERVSSQHRAKATKDSSLESKRGWSKDDWDETQTRPF